MGLPVCQMALALHCQAAKAPELQNQNLELLLQLCKRRKNLRKLGLSMEAMTLMRKKKERLMKETEQTDEGLNLSKNGGTEHTTKLEALLAKPIDDMPRHSEKGLLSTNGDPPRTEGV